MGNPFRVIILFVSIASDGIRGYGWGTPSEFYESVTFLFTSIFWMELILDYLKIWIVSYGYILDKTASGLKNVVYLLRLDP